MPAPYEENSSKAQSFESGAGTDNRAITKTSYFLARQNNYIFFIFLHVFHTTIETDIGNVF